MLHRRPRPFARARRIFGKPAFLSGSFVYGVYALVLVDHVHGSIARTALDLAAGLVPCALAGCLLALVLVPLMAILTTPTRGARGIVAKTLKASAVLGIVAALVVVLDHLGRVL